MANTVLEYTLSLLLSCSLLHGCGDSQAPPSEDNPAPQVEANCDSAGPKVLCRASAEGVKAHIEEFGPIQKHMDLVILTGFDPNEVEELQNIESAFDVTLKNLESEDLMFLRNLKEVSRIFAERNFKLKSLKGLEKVEKITNYLELRENTALESLEGLENLRTVKPGGVGDGIFLLQNHSLKNLDALSSLEVTSLLNVQSNDGFETPGTLPQLQSVGSLVLNNNDAMVDAGAYPKLEEAEFLVFKKNGVMPDCDGEKVAEAIPNFDGELTLEDNKPNSRCEDIE